jgi:hypothetical protein
MPISLRKNVYSELWGLLTSHFLENNICRILKLANVSYIIIIKNRQLIGNIQGHNIYQIVSTSMISITSSKDIESKDSYLKEFKNLLDSGDFYFSYSWDLTNSYQRQEGVSYDIYSSNDDICNYLDTRFWWNEHLLSDLTQLKIGEWVLPVIRGYIQIQPLTVLNRSILFILISRRSKYMSGTRYHTRGCDFRVAIL